MSTKQSLCLGLLRATSLRSVSLAMTICAMSMCSYVYAQSVSSTDLINQALNFDGKQIEFEGEAIGDLMRRGDHTLVNLHDGDNAIGVWAPSGIMPKVGHLGAYNSKGDRIKVKGVFHRACAIHGSDLDIHASDAVVTRPGKKINELPDLYKRRLVIILTGLLCLVLTLRILKSRRAKK